MCNITGILFGLKNLTNKEVKDKKILEIGSYDLNGSLRPVIESWKPNKYVGIDIVDGPGVDIICRAEDVLDKFGKESFDIVISTELIEHVRGWRKVISNIKNICRPNGIILITTRSKDFNYHAHPHDYWRYELEDIKNIFSDCDILILEKDLKEPGVFAKIRKPIKFLENGLSDYKLYSIVTNRRVIDLDTKDFKTFYFYKIVFKEKLKRFAFRIGKSIFSKI